MRTTWRPSVNSPPALGASMTPLIDVVFLLLIFFVCTASFQPVETLLPSDLLISGASDLDAPLEPEPELERVVLGAEVSPAGVVWQVNGRRCDNLTQLRAVLVQLAKIDARLPVIVDPDSRTPLGVVVSGYDAARAAGLSDIKFAASADPGLTD